MEPGTVEYNKSERIKWLDVIKTLSPQVDKEKKDFMNFESNFV